MADICGAKTRHGTLCKQPAGWGTHHPGAGRCKFHGGCSNGPPSGSKNALKTGQYENIFSDQLDKEEQEIWDGLNCEKLYQLEMEIKLLTIRERRMMERIQRLKTREYSISAMESTEGTERGKPTSLKKSILRGTLGQIQDIEEALTRVQAQKARLIEIKHRIEEGSEDNQELNELVGKLERYLQQEAN